MVSLECLFFYWAKCFKPIVWFFRHLFDVSLQSSSTMAEKAILVEGTCCLVTGGTVVGASSRRWKLWCHVWRCVGCGAFLKNERGRSFSFFSPAVGWLLTFRGTFERSCVHCCAWMWFTFIVFYTFLFFIRAAVFGRTPISYRHYIAFTKTFQKRAIWHVHSLCFSKQHLYICHFSRHRLKMQVFLYVLVVPTRYATLCLIQPSAISYNKGTH